ncbi:hypothetical protein [Paracoccus chinensis]|uniref:hypothetical protein n=1 Tax=Paracoccus chinensis TaxID=525640 RepID=UPI000B86834A|nr:hypothetical protein [Paracoccus chinensis]
MKFLSFIGYPSYPGRDKADWKAYNATMALKGADFNGYADIRIRGKLHRISGQNTKPILDFFGWKIVKCLEVQPAGTAIFVLPSSGCIDFGQDPKAARFVQAIVDAGCKIPVAMPFHWSELMPKAAGGGGPRNSAVLQPKLRFLPPPGIHRAILVDDVMTSGGHIRAAARIIRARGITPVGAICFARTMGVRPADILAPIHEEIDL